MLGHVFGTNIILQSLLYGDKVVTTRQMLKLKLVLQGPTPSLPCGKNPEIGNLSIFRISNSNLVSKVFY
jgi:hypothetical protein